MEIVEKTPELRELPRPAKLTVERLKMVERLQVELRIAGNTAAMLAKDESNGWVPGSPQTERSHRVDDLEALADALDASIDLLERLYS